MMFVFYVFMNIFNNFELQNQPMNHAKLSKATNATPDTSHQRVDRNAKDNLKNSKDLQSLVFLLSILKNFYFPSSLVN